jgi:hypothetical protein
MWTAETLASFPPPAGSGLYEVVRLIRIKPIRSSPYLCDASGRQIRLPAYANLLGTVLHVGPAALDENREPFNPIKVGTPDYLQLQAVIDAHPDGLPYEKHRELFRRDGELARNFTHGYVVVRPKGMKP